MNLTNMETGRKRKEVREKLRCRRKEIEKNKKMRKVQGKKAEARKRKRNENGTKRENRKSKQRKVGTGET